jgi:hypothetical protein
VIGFDQPSVPCLQRYGQPAIGRMTASGAPVDSGDTAPFTTSDDGGGGLDGHVRLSYGG